MTDARPDTFARHLDACFDRLQRRLTIGTAVIVALELATLVAVLVK